MLLLNLIRNVIHKTYLYQKQDHLRESQQDAESYKKKTEATLLANENLVLSISTVELQDARRQKVSKLIEDLRKHQRKEQFLKDMSQKKEINKFSEESK